MLARASSFSVFSSAHHLIPAFCRPCRLSSLHHPPLAFYLNSLLDACRLSPIPASSSLVHSPPCISRRDSPLQGPSALHHARSRPSSKHHQRRRRQQPFTFFPTSTNSSLDTPQSTSPRRSCCPTLWWLRLALASGVEAKRLHLNTHRFIISHPPTCAPANRHQGEVTSDDEGGRPERPQIATQLHETGGLSVGVWIRTTSDCGTFPFRRFLSHLSYPLSLFPRVPILPSAAVCRIPASILRHQAIGLDVRDLRAPGLLERSIPPYTNGSSSRLRLSPEAETTFIDPSALRTFLRSSRYFPPPRPPLLPVNPPSATKGDECNQSSSRGQLGSNRGRWICVEPAQAFLSKYLFRRAEVGEDITRVLAQPSTTSVLCLSSYPIPSVPSIPSLKAISRTLRQGSRNLSIVHLELSSISRGIGLGHAEVYCFVDA
ncbi:hypothetical protein FA13DRAFT_1178224 [Coprinellus micaceus]|uniref:Uncharacterized protein n=1 Tax=Coprinellus micaceus TaxID=71717 RepID=A0A4Y7SUI1_COPMI|nr:hypothetical protein FA13DRAFT_1178224 [Coprinellus micaceus]